MSDKQRDQDLIERGREVARDGPVVDALRVCRDLAEEELQYSKVGTGAEVALRHIARRAREAIALVESL